MFHTHIFAVVVLNAIGALAQLPNGYFGYENARWTECTNFLSTCKPTISTCAKYLCGECYSIGGSGFKSCCGQPTPYLCFQSAEGNAGGNGGPAYITSSPPPVTNPEQLACQTAADILQSCEAATSGFDNLDDADAASCLCYSGTSWQPQLFDQPWSSCLAWASTGDASDYPSWNSLRGFCSSVGEVVNSPASVPASTTSGSPHAATPLTGPPTTNAPTTNAPATNAPATNAVQSSTVAVPVGPTPSKSGAGKLQLNNLVPEIFILLVAFPIVRAYIL